MTAHAFTSTTPVPIGRFGPPRAAPVITTDRLRLDGLTRDDWPAYHDLMTGPRAKHMGGPLDLPEAWGWFCSDHAGWSLGGAGSLAIRHGDDTVGEVSLNDLPYFPEPELGWMVYDGHEGQGYATEAARAVLDWLAANHRPPTLVSYTDPDNAASIAVARRLGATLDAGAPTPEDGDLCWRHW
ncbi:GNAT family N-acetyltransferase [Jannaschia sp. LMIT008]|uniref:GNAT family N-acetyltransferase n=1 Tax=Jannaschia maritima TaxID=3032585 RepID=UPI002811681B|nr:GNAT family N-acetyltransferase [Jannaschia sp. LMIT008]